MACTVLDLPWGGKAIVCGTRGRPRRQCGTCKGPAKFLCDWKLDATTTCDAAMCAEYTLAVAPEKHLCADHQKAWRAHPRFRA